MVLAADRVTATMRGSPRVARALDYVFAAFAAQLLLGRSRQRTAPRLDRKTPPEAPLISRSWRYVIGPKGRFGRGASRGSAIDGAAERRGFVYIAAAQPGTRDDPFPPIAPRPQSRVPPTPRSSPARSSSG